MCGKKEPDQEGDYEEFDGENDLIIDWWDCQKCKRWFHQICSGALSPGSLTKIVILLLN